MVFGERGARAGGGGQRADGQPTVGVGGMAEQQPQDLPAGITAGTGHRHRSHAAILHGYADCCKSILTRHGQSCRLSREPSPGIVRPGIDVGNRDAAGYPSASRIAAAPYGDRAAPRQHLLRGDQPERRTHPGDAHHPERKERRHQRPAAPHTPRPCSAPICSAPDIAIPPGAEKEAERAPAVPEADGLQRREFEAAARRHRSPGAGERGTGRPDHRWRRTQGDRAACRWYRRPALPLHIDRQVHRGDTARRRRRDAGAQIHRARGRRHPAAGPGRSRWRTPTVPSRPRSTTSLHAQIQRDRRRDGRRRSER